MTNSPIIIGLQIVDPMLITGVILSAGTPFVFTYLRKNRWKVSLGQLMLATVPIGIFSYGVCHHVQRCEQYRLSGAGYFTDPVENFLYMSLGHTNAFMTAFCVSCAVVWLMANLRSQTQEGALQE